MTNKYTPGPWSMNGPTLIGNGYNIGSVNSHRTTEGEANARLIAAAPDLLAALDRLQAFPNDPRAHRQALDAIAKAKGETK